MQNANCEMQNAKCETRIENGNSNKLKRFYLFV